MKTQELIIKLEKIDQMVSVFHLELEKKTNETSDEVHQNGVFTDGAIANKLDERVNDIDELLKKLRAEKEAIEAEIEKISAKKAEEYSK